MGQGTPGFLAIDGLLLSIVCFADNIILAAQDVDMAYRILLRIISALSGAGFEVQPQKLNWCGNARIDVGLEISLDGHILQRASCEEGLVVLGNRLSLVDKFTS